MILYLCILLILAILYWWKNFAKLPCAKFPPGPMGLPLVGYLPIVTGDNILAALDDIHDKYGEVISVNMGPSPRLVVIGDLQALKEAFKDDRGNGRPPEQMWFNEEFRFGNGQDSRGLLFSVVGNISYLRFSERSFRYDFI